MFLRTLIFRALSADGESLSEGEAAEPYGDGETGSVVCPLNGYTVLRQHQRIAVAFPCAGIGQVVELEIPNSVDATEIPEYVFESLARSLLPVIQKYYESEDGKKVFADWKAKREVPDSVST